MKLDENGDFCLLYVEPADEKQSLFETIGAQTKPVVLMLPLLSGRPRSRLFQRPEDFSDLKHVRRQSGVSVVFVAAGSEFLAQQAIRYGFPAYPSIDAFADMLAHGHRVEHDEGEAKAPRRARTGPLVPSAAQLAAIRRSVPTTPLSAPPADVRPWPSPESGSLPIEYPASFHKATTAPLGAPTDLAFWEAPENGARPAMLSTPGLERVTPPPGRLSSYLTPAAPAREEETAQPAPRFSEIPRRRSAQLAEEPYTRHPGWEPEERMFEHTSRPLTDRLSVPSPAPKRTAARPALDTLAQVSRSAQTRPAIEVPASRPPVQPPELKLRQRQGFSPLLLILSLLILSGAALGSFLAIAHVAPATPTVARPVGSITFLSSEQVNENTSQGIDDEVQILLHTLGSPAPGKSYYAWLLGDKTQSESQSILLGRLNVVNGSVDMLYPGNAPHMNLLQLTSRFLITEEVSSVLPLLPSPDTSAWRYYGALPATPDPSDAHHFSFLNHLRHLLADEPILDEMELPGGLNNWFTRNTEKLIEWTSSARDRWQDTHDLASVRALAMQILSYLDGMSFVVQDLPSASAKLQVPLDTHLAALGLLNVRGTGQNPPSYMDQIVYHLNGLLNAPGSPASTRSTAAALLPALSNVTTWLQALRSDDKQLLAMSDRQMGQPAALSLLDDMVLQASNAYTGNTDAATGQLKQGVVWIHQHLQDLATININTYVPGAVVPEIGPSTPNAPSYVAPLLAAWRDLEELV